MTSKMAESKMAASTLDCKMLEALNVAMCSTPTGSTRSPPGHSTPIAEETTTYHSLEGGWNKVVSKKKNKKTGRKSTPRASKDKPVVQQRTPSPPRADPVPITGPKQGSGGGGGGGRRRAGKEYPPHEKYDLDEVVTDKLENRGCNYVIIKAYRQQRPEEDINVFHLLHR